MRHARAKLTASRPTRSARDSSQVCRPRAHTYGQFAPFVRPVLVKAAAGEVIAPRGRPVSVMAFLVRQGKIVAIDVLADPERLRKLDLGVWPGSE